MDGSEGSYDGAPPPFLTKTYEMVDDPMTNSIVSWSQSGLSFVVWNPLEFATELLPFYFKHNNFSSFVRQLNTYGFRKMDRDHWEFGNEGFIRGQTHLLKTIHRRKPIYSHSHSHGNEAPLSDTERQELKLKIKTLHKKNATLKSQMEEHENEKEQIKGQIQGLSQQLWRMGNEQKEMIRKMEAELEKHNRGGKKRKMGKLSEVLVDQDWLVPPLEVMGKLELWLDLVEDMEKEVKVVKESGQNGMNDGFWEQFLTEIPHISNSGDVCLHTRNSVVR